MANYTTKLKAWGSTGQEYPDNYSYLEDEAPVDAWDNFLTHNLISDVRSHLIPLTNSRIESDYGTTKPGSPEDGHLFYDTDDGDRRVFRYRSDTSAWEDFAMGKDLRAHEARTDNPHSVTLEQARSENATLSGNVNMGNNSLTGLAGATFQSGDARIVHSAREVTIEEYDGASWTARLLVDESGADVTGSLTVSGDLTVSGTAVLNSTTNANGNSVTNVGTLTLDDSDSDGNQWSITENGTSGALELDYGATSVLTGSATAVNVLVALREQGDRVATRTWSTSQFLDVSGDSMSGTLDLSGNDLKDGATTIWDTLSGHVPLSSLQENAITVTAGSGLSTGGTATLGGSVTVDHADTSTQANVSAGAGAAITSVNVDTYGHVTSLGTTSFDGRYVNANGDTMTGALTIDGGGLTVTGADDSGTTVLFQPGSNTATTGAPSIKLDVRGDIVDNTTTIWDSAIGEIPDSAMGTIKNSTLANDSVTVTAGSGLTTGGTVALGGSVTVDHADTSTQGDVSAAAGAAITSINVDGFGHITSIGTTDFDGRFYNEGQKVSDSDQWDGYQLQKNGSDTTGVINFKT